MLAPILKRVAGRAVRSPALQQQSRAASAYGDIVAGPPTNKISGAEMLVHGAFIVLGVMGYPMIAAFTVAGHKRAEFAEMEIPENWAAWKERQQKK
ncbi:putative serine acetyltransferase 3 [Frankliniella fusca]|uniref:Serine acetyltransferase 3 n=1 Tax=Frankliniella fusca TaxID=407009 RepID=A0AAE1HYI4_9NEOP|nr:putative serine acetyltransferase 3 [Frankliniella fusca]